MILGTAALVIAKSGLGVDPGFWPLDIVAMLLGCLLGAFLPAFASDAAKIAGSNKRTSVQVAAWTTISLVALSVFFAGVPEQDYKEDWSFYTSASLLGAATAVLGFLMIYVPRWSDIGKQRGDFVEHLRSKPSG